MGFKLGARQRLTATTAIYFLFFVSELIVAIRTKSLALTADAFHYLNDLIGFVVALAALIVKERKGLGPTPLTYGWQRAPVVGAFFNGAFLLALGVSIFFQSLERFIGTNKVEETELILVLGCVGLLLNIISAVLLHGHHSHGHGHSHCSGHHDIENAKASRSASSVDIEEVFEDSVYRQLHAHHNHLKLPMSTSDGKDLGMLGVMIHVICDAINNIGVIIAAAIMSFTTSEQRFLADPAASTCISLMILVSALPLIKSSGEILLQSAPSMLNVREVQDDLEQIPGIESVHELHIWQLDESKTIASAHLVVSGSGLSEFAASAQTARDCLHAYGIHSATLQPEFLDPRHAKPYRTPDHTSGPCQAQCSKDCRQLVCCADRAEPNEGGKGSLGVGNDSDGSTLYTASLDKVDKL